MALKATVFKATLQLADMDRNLYGDHGVTLARHPSETDERMMVRLLAYALQVPADPLNGALAFAKGLWDPDEPELWQKDLTGRIVHWIDIGQPDERERRECGERGLLCILLCPEPVVCDAVVVLGHLDADEVAARVEGCDSGRA